MKKPCALMPCITHNFHGILYIYKPRVTKDNEVNTTLLSRVCVPDYACFWASFKVMLTILSSFTVHVSAFAPRGMSLCAWLGTGGRTGVSMAAKDDSGAQRSKDRMQVRRDQTSLHVLRAGLHSCTHTHP